MVNQRHMWRPFFRERARSLWSRFWFVTTVFATVVLVIAGAYVISVYAHTKALPPLDFLGEMWIAMSLGAIAIIFFTFGGAFLVLLIMSAFSRGRRLIERRNWFPLSLEIRVGRLENRVGRIENGLNDLVATLRNIEEKLEGINKRLLPTNNLRDDKGE